MERIVFVNKEDNECSRRIIPWISTFMTATKDEELPSAEKEVRGRDVLFRWILATNDFSQVCSHSVSMQWLDRNTLIEQFDKWKRDSLQQRVEDDEDFSLQASLHDTADSLPVIGCNFRVFIFLGQDDMNSNESFVHFASAILRFIQWHHAHVVIVMLTQELSPLGRKLVALVSDQTVSISDCWLASNISWSGEISVTDYVVKNSITYSGVYADYSNWNFMLEQAFPSVCENQRKCLCRDQMNTASKSVTRRLCDHSIEVLQEIDLKTFPTFMMTPIAFNLHYFPTASLDTSLVEYLQEKPHVGLVARLCVYQTCDMLPLCGSTKQFSTSAWKEYIMATPSNPKSLGSDCCLENNLTNFEYLNLLIVSHPTFTFSSNTTSTTSCLWARVLLTPMQVAQHLLDVVTQHKPLEKLCSNFSDGMVVGDGSMQNCLRKLPILKVDKLCSFIKECAGYDLQAIDNKEGEENQMLRSLKKMMGQPIGDLLNKVDMDGKDIPQEGSDNVMDWATCSEWVALTTGCNKQKHHHMSNGDLFSTTSYRNLQEKSNSKDFSIDRVINLFGGKDGAENQHMFNIFSDTVSQFGLDLSDSNDSRNIHDVLHYKTVEDYDSELKYAHIRDRIDFPDTQSSFVTPQKKATKQFRPIMPTRSSPRTKLFTRNLSSCSLSPPKSSQHKETFKQPQFLHNNSSFQRRRSSQSLTLASNEDKSYRRSSIQCKRSASSLLTPESDHFLFSKQSCRSRSNTPSPLSSKSSTSTEANLSSSSLDALKRVPFTTVLETSEQLVRRSPRKPQYLTSKLEKEPKQMDSTKRKEETPPNSQRQSATSSTSGKLKRSERHMMRLKSIITNALAEKGVNERDALHQACAKNLLNVSIILLKTLPNSQNLTAEMKSVVYGQVQQIINLEKRRSGIVL